MYQERKQRRNSKRSTHALIVGYLALIIALIGLLVALLKH